MLRRQPLRIALVYGLSLLLGAGVLAGLTSAALRLDRTEAESRLHAEFEERIRLALWRMDSIVAPLIAEESARPYFSYVPFYPLEQAYTRMFAPIEKDMVLVPSPLLSGTPTYLLLSFQRDPDGRTSSPQVPVGNMRDRADPGYTNSQVIAQYQARLESFTQQILDAGFRDDLPVPGDTTLKLALQFANNPSVQGKPSSTADDFAGSGMGMGMGMMSGNVPNRTDSVQSPKMTDVTPGSGVETNDPNTAGLSQSAVNNEGYPFFAGRGQQVTRNNAEFQKRNQITQNSRSQNLFRAQNRMAPTRPVREGAMKPVWRNGMLILARRVGIEDHEYIQGSWMDWETLRRDLLAEVNDLAPDAELEPVIAGQTAEESRMLTALPVRLKVRPPTLDDIRSQVDGEDGADQARFWLTGMSPIRFALALAWSGMGLAVLATSALLFGAVRLSERRGVFVSAVTHELRTPLTTFRLYADMLSEGMVTQEQQRREYYLTLKTEADRLAHLVENVLAYARLERGQIARPAGVYGLGDVLLRMESRLRGHAERAGMEFILRVDADDRKEPVRTEPTALEQVVFNLVDNACKYASQGKNSHVEITAVKRGAYMRLAIKDQGPGIGRRAARWLFQPFSKSAEDAAGTASGVGLGLALSRNLARTLGGDLRLAPATAGGGACFLLDIPRASPQVTVTRSPDINEP